MSTAASKSRAWWLLLLLPVLVVQSLAALRLVWLRSAFIDEATYGYAGSQELAHWIHGIPVANFQEWLAGAPAVYPPIDALVTSIGGLAGARLLSLAFMLGATLLLYATGSSLFGRRSGLLGAALFGALGTTQFLSALATFDAMALCCLAGAVYVLVRWGGRLDLPSVIYSSVAAPVILALADAAKYATALWDPFLVGLAIAVPMMAGQSWRHGIARGMRFAVVLAFLIAGLLAIGKAKYVAGIMGSTLSRSKGVPGMGTPAKVVLHAGLALGGVPIAVAAVGLILLAVPGPGAPRAPWGARVIAGWVFFLASVAPVIAQARIGTTVSLEKHVVYGAWFGCVLGGYALARLLKYRVPLVACGLALVTVLPVYYLPQAQRLDNWPIVNKAFTAGLERLVRPGRQEYLLTGLLYIPAYYVGPSVNSLQWKMDFGDDFTYQPPGTHTTLNGIPAIDAAIQRRKFDLIIVEPGQTANSATLAAIQRYGGYRIDGFLPAPFLGGGSQPCQIWKRYGRVTSSP